MTVAMVLLIVALVLLAPVLLRIAVALLACVVAVLYGVREFLADCWWELRHGGEWD